MYIDDITDEDLERWAQEEIDSRPELSLKMLYKLCKDNNCIERRYSKGEFFDVYVYPIIWRDIIEEEDVEIWKNSIFYQKAISKKRAQKWASAV